ncbi:MAG: glycosyltransferase [Cellulomonas sp.]
MGIESALAAVRAAPSILEGMRRAEDLTRSALGAGDPADVARLAAAAVDASDQFVAIAAIHALARVTAPSVDLELGALLTHPAPFVREHAAWALDACRPSPDAVPRLVQLVADGAFTAMIAQRTLQRWGVPMPDRIASAVSGALHGIDDPAARARLVETAGLVRGALAAGLLRRVAADAHEALPARAAAVAGLGDQPAEAATRELLTDLAAGSDELADVARLALVDLTGPTDPPDPSRPGDTAGAQPRGSRGLTIAQLFLHADIDRELAQVGAGDNGGIATLLVRLGDALVAEAGGTGADDPVGVGRIERVLTISRARPAAVLAALTHGPAVGHSFVGVPFLGTAAPSIDAWPQRVAAERGIRRVLRAAGPVDVLHLRMADVGSLAAATVAHDLDLPFVFTLAPDPHAVIRAAEGAGTLTRANFGAIDAVEHFWFRVRLVQRLTADAAHLVLFPRPNLEQDLRELLGLDLTTHPERYSVIAEGIDVEVTERSIALARAAVPPPAPFAELDALLATIPAARRGLPLAVSVGRLHRIKGMAALVEAWAADPTLHDRCNLLVVGGDLARPTSDEREQLARIDAAVPAADATARGLLLAGHRANGMVARWLAAIRFGRPGLAAPHGVYVCASVKEEFGIALLEAMATGLAVVAPDSGGPATYVEHGTTGFLVNTADPAALAGGIRAALDLAAGPRGAEGSARAQQVVHAQFTIQAMAATLSAAYDGVVAPRPTPTRAMMSS